MGFFETKEGKFTNTEQVYARSDLEGNITLANKAFFDLTGFGREEVVGAKHSILRHPQMPSVIYRVIWNKLQKDETVIVFIRNLSKNKKEYWIVNEISPNISDGVKIGYIAQGGKPSSEAIKEIKNLYDRLVQTERKVDIMKSAELLKHFLKEKNMTYNEYMGYLIRKEDKWYSAIFS